MKSQGENIILKHVKKVPVYHLHALYYTTFYFKNKNKNKYMYAWLTPTELDPYSAKYMQTSFFVVTSEIMIREFYF